MSIVFLKSKQILEKHLEIHADWRGFFVPSAEQEGFPVPLII